MKALSLFDRVGAHRAIPFRTLALSLLASGTTPADVFSRVPEAGDYELVYELDIPVDGVFQGAGLVPYTTDNSATVAPAGFDRVAYYLELTDGSGTDWVYASMRAFTALAAKTGLPHDITNPTSFQQAVDDLTVLSNVPGVRTGSFDKGQVEMWHPTYTAPNAASVFAASATTNDWGDTIGGVASGYGCFQIHNPGSRQVVLAYNRWATGGATNDDVGIGNSPGTHPDWTFSSNTNSYSSRKLVVLVRPKRFEVSFDEIPANQQVSPRDPLTNLATVPISGSESLGGFDKAALRIFRDGVPHGSELEQVLDYSDGPAGFLFEPEIPAELASYSFELSLIAGGDRFPVKQVTDVLGGDVFLWYGQSNAEGIPFSGSADAYLSPWIRTYGMSSDSAATTLAYPFWVEADGDGSRDVPAGVGQWALVVGKRIVDTQGIPVAILNGARAGYSMPQLQRDDANPDNLADGGGVTRPYNRLRHRAIQANVADQVRAIFFYQGESDANNAAQHVSGFASLMEDWQTDYPGVERVFVTQVHVGCGGNIVARELPELRDLQRHFPDVYPSVRIMSTNGLTTHTDNCHFPFTGGYETHGLNSFRQLERELYGAPDIPAIDAPNPARVELANEIGDRVRIVLRDPDAGITVDPTSLVDFRLTGSAAIPLSATVTSGAIELQYADPIPGSTTLDYLAHIGSGGGWIRNSNGVGLLTFTEPVIDPRPQLTLISPAGVTELAPGSPYLLEASASSPNDSITRMEIQIDGIPHTALNDVTSISTNWTMPAEGSHTILFRATDSEGREVEESVVILSGSTTSPGGVGTGLKVWLRPETGIIRDANGSVSEWLDSSGQGNSCTQGTPSARPTFHGNVFGVMPGVAFDGDDVLVATGGMSTGSYTKVVRVSMSDFAGSSNILSSGEASNTPVRHALFTSDSPHPRIWHKGIFVTSSSPMTAHQSHLIVATYDATTKSGALYLDGTPVGTGTTPRGDNVDPSYHLGGLASALFMRGAVGEAIIYDRVISATERGDIENYLNSKVIAPPAAPLIDYTTWSGENITPPSDDSPGGDANLNGIANVIEFALGIEPEAGGIPSILDLSVNSGTVSVAYSRPTNRDGVSIQLFESPDLETWSPVADTAGPITNAIEQREYSRAIGDSDELFYRLQVTLVP